MPQVKSWQSICNYHNCPPPQFSSTDLFWMTIHRFCRQYGCCQKLGSKSEQSINNCPDLSIRNSWNRPVIGWSLTLSHSSERDSRCAEFNHYKPPWTNFNHRFLLLVTVVLGWILPTVSSIISSINFGSGKLSLIWLLFRPPCLIKYNWFTRPRIYKAKNKATIILKEFQNEKIKISESKKSIWKIVGPSKFSDFKFQKFLANKYEENFLYFPGTTSESKNMRSEFWSFRTWESRNSAQKCGELRISNSSRRRWKGQIQGRFHSEVVFGRT